eukprot:g7471.t1
MTELKSVLYRFNGHCDFSRDADLVLRFTDNSTLKTHSLFLKKTSSIFNQLIASPSQQQEEEGNQVIFMDSNNSFPWCVMLNYFYPGLLHNDTSILLHERVVEGVIREARRYEMKSIESQIDREAKKLMNEMQTKLELHLCTISEAFHFMKRHKTLIKIAAKYELPLSHTSATNCLSAFLDRLVVYCCYHHCSKTSVRNVCRMKEKLEFNNSVLVLGTDRFDFTDLIDVGYSDVLFRFHSLLHNDEP